MRKHLLAMAMVGLATTAAWAQADSTRAAVDSVQVLSDSLRTTPEAVFAAEASEGAYDLQACIDYAIAHSEAMQLAEMDIQIAQRQVNETIGRGLPQIDGQVQYINNYNIQTQFLPAAFFPPDQVPPGADFVPVQFGVQHSTVAGVTLNQLIFDYSYIVGLQASNSFKELSVKQSDATKQDIVANVTKAYYAVLVNKTRLELIYKNYALIQDQLSDTEGLYQAGFAEKIDVNRVRVQFNNIENERTNAERGLGLALAVLKFQMGMDLAEQVKVAGDLKDIDLDAVRAKSSQFGNFDYSSRIDYDLAKQQVILAELDWKNSRAALYPNLYGFSGLGWNVGTNEFGDQLNINNWFRYGNVGLTLNIPIFTGRTSWNVVQRKRIEWEKTQVQVKQLQRSIDLELVNTTNTMLQNLETVRNAEENMALAQEVYDVTSAKFAEGVGSNLEVTQAQTDYQAARTNYLGAMYNLLLATVDYDLATGNLLDN